MQSNCQCQLMSEIELKREMGCANDMCAKCFYLLNVNSLSPNTINN